jgi:hypothetical protein
VLEQKQSGDTNTDQDAEAVEPAASSEEAAPAADSDEPTETQE